MSWLILLSTLSSCAVLHPYTAPIQQGKIITKEMIYKVKPGMSKNQVDYILGTPDIYDLFSPEKSIYSYTYQEKTNGSKEVRYLILIFKDDKLSTISGDYPPPQVVYSHDYTN